MVMIAFNNDIADGWQRADEYRLSAGSRESRDQPGRELRRLRAVALGAPADDRPSRFRSTVPLASRRRSQRAAARARGRPSIRPLLLPRRRSSTAVSTVAARSRQRRARERHRAVRVRERRRRCLDARARAAAASGIRRHRGLHERRDVVLPRPPGARLRRTRRASAVTTPSRRHWLLSSSPMRRAPLAPRRVTTECRCMPSPPPGVSERDFQAALRALEGVVGRDWLFASDEDVLLYRDGYSPLWGEAEERLASAAVAPNLGRAGPGHRQDREPVRLAALSDLDGPQSHLRRRGARVLGQRRRRSEAHESHPRRQRARQDLPRRARRQLLRSLPALAHEQDPALDRHGRPRLGRADRQRARPRRRLHGHRVSRSLRRALRHGGRAADGRGRAHGHGREPAGQDVAALQIRLGPVGRRHLLAVELRHRHEDGLLAHGGARGGAASQRHRAEAPRRRAARRHAAQPDVRAHDAVAGATSSAR